MRNCKYLALLFFLVIIACQDATPLQKRQKEVKNSSAKEANKNKAGKNKTPKVLGDFINCNEDAFWIDKQQGDASNYLIGLTFKEDYLIYRFHGQCYYWYFTNYYHTGTDKIELLWSYKTDCLLNMEFLEKTNGVKKFPRVGDSFCEYALVNDSVINVKYNFPEWVKEVNKIAEDTIFPNRLYLQKIIF
jgi:hypothetical protein